MIPTGYMAKRVYTKSEWRSDFPNFLKGAEVEDIFSVSGCISENFADYIRFWKHNGYWFYDSPEIFQSVAREHSIDLEGTKLFYYEVHELEFEDECWRPFGPQTGLPTNVLAPARKQLEGFDVVTFSAGAGPECSPLSCNYMAEELATNTHCLFATFTEAEAALSRGAFTDAEPGPYRIFAVYSVDRE